VLFLVLIIIMWIFPYYSVKIDPIPNTVPGLDILPVGFDVDFNNITINSRDDFLKMLSYDPVVKRTADLVILKSGCQSNKVCHSKALFYFVRDNFNYVSDPTTFEYVKTARESILTQGGDCDDGSVLLANLLNSIGVTTRFVFVPQHVYVQAKIDDALNKYKDDGWVNLDVTCNSCEFGQMSYRYSDVDKFYVG